MIKYLFPVLFLILFNCKNTPQIQQNHSKNETDMIEISIGTDWALPLSGGTYTLQNAPKGMRIFPGGLLTWTPTNNQAGDFEVRLLDLDQKIYKRLHFKVKGKPVIYAGYFVDFAYQGLERGTPEQPYSHINAAFKAIRQGEFTKLNIYIRGGIYKNRNYGRSKDHKSVDWIKFCQGSKDKIVTIRPWGNEYVKILSDGSAALSLRKSSYLQIQNLEIEGVAQSIKFDSVLNHWWQTQNYYKGQGISINRACHNISIQNCIVHDFPGAGISVHNSDAIQIKQNIIYNNAWWSIAGTGGAVITQSQYLAADTTQISSNLLFGMESRVFSRVFKKGFAKLVIDEGEAVLIQEFKDTGKGYDYEKIYTVKNNFLAYNGKGLTINKADHVHIRNNSLYHSKSLRVGGASHHNLMIKNVVEVAPGGFWLSVSKQAKGLIVMHNFYNKIARIKYKPGNKMLVFKDNKALPQVYEHLFYPVSTVRQNKAGADQSAWHRLQKMIDQYAIKVAPPLWESSPDKMQLMTDKIISGAKKLSPKVSIDSTYFKNAGQPIIFVRNLPSDFVRKQGLPSNHFKLILKTFNRGR